MIIAEYDFDFDQIYENNAMTLGVYGFLEPSLLRKVVGRTTQLAYKNNYSPAVAPRSPSDVFCVFFTSATY